MVPTKHRVSVKQNYRANVPLESANYHYRWNLFNPFIDHIINKLDGRFSERNELTMVAAYLILDFFVNILSLFVKSTIKIIDCLFLCSGETPKISRESNNYFPYCPTALKRCYTTHTSWFSVRLEELCVLNQHTVHNCSVDVSWACGKSAALGSRSSGGYRWRPEPELHPLLVICCWGHQKVSLPLYDSSCTDIPLSNFC